MNVADFSCSEFESARIFRPRLLVRGLQGMGQQYLGAALLNKFEGLHVQSFDLANLLKDSTRVSISSSNTSVTITNLSSVPGSGDSPDV